MNMISLIKYITYTCIHTDIIDEFIHGPVLFRVWPFSGMHGLAIGSGDENFFNYAIFSN